MNITINGDLTRTYTDERGLRRVVYFTLTDENGAEYKMLDDLPGDADPQTYLDAHIEAECLFARQEEYETKPVLATAQDQTQLDAVEAWIAGGCQIVTGKDADGQDVIATVAKQTWRPRW
jgi:hypothetical protein